MQALQDTDGSDMVAISKEWPQPIRYVAETANAFVVLAKLPWYLASSAVPSLRPRPTWSFKKSLIFRIAQPSIPVNKTSVGYQPGPNHKAIKGGKGILGVWIDPVPELIVGNIEKWAHDANVMPIRIPGYWLHKNGYQFSVGQKPGPLEKCVYYIHGGAFMTISAHTDGAGSLLPKAILEFCPTVTRTFSVEYRLTTGPPLEAEGMFPAALLDALAGYNYLINTVGFTPSQIILFGDSAGANIVLALARYLVENAAALTKLSLPGGLFLLSPWADLLHEDHSPDSALTRNKDHDIILPPSRCAMGWAVRHYAGPLGIEGLKKNPYLSPASSHLDSSIFRGFPSTFIAAGEGEIFLDGIRRLHVKMKEELGDKVTYFEGKDCVHDFMAFDFEEPQRSLAFGALSEWISSLQI